MDKFLEMCNFPTLNQEVIDNLNRLVTSSEIEFIIIIMIKLQKVNNWNWTASQVISTKQRKVAIYPFQVYSNTVSPQAIL